LELLKRSLLNELTIDMEAQLLHTVLSCANQQPLELESFWRARRNQGLIEAIRTARDGGDTLWLKGRLASGGTATRYDLRNYSEFAATLIGRKRLDHLQTCAETAILEGIEGDFLEAGVWRGGACILLAGVLKAYGESRNVWLADSFEGLPAATEPEDQGWDLSATVLPVLAVSREEVTELFIRYDLLGENIRFLAGFFRETLPTYPGKRLAILRIDADLYSSTWEALTQLYPFVADGGFVIVDDYGSIEPCRNAVDLFTSKLGGVSLKWIDAHGVFWRRNLSTEQKKGVIR